MSDPTVNNGVSDRRRRPTQARAVGHTLTRTGDDQNAWKRKVPYARGDGIDRTSTAAASGQPSAAYGSNTTSTSTGRILPTRRLLPLQPLQADGTVEDAANVLIGNHRLPSAKPSLDVGFSGRGAPIQPSFRSSRQDALLVPRQASESGLVVKITTPTTRLGRLLDSVSQLGKKLLIGSHKGELSTLPLSILASRVMYLAVLLMALNMPEIYERLNQPPSWSYSPGRSLKGRDCIMSLYIEKMKVCLYFGYPEGMIEIKLLSACCLKISFLRLLQPNELNYDFVTPKLPKGKKKKDHHHRKQPPYEIVNGTYRTKGQVKVIKRFIEAVANSYRSNYTIAQHLIFTNVRDSGHLAEKALHHWPPRGTYITQLHIIAADEELDHDEKQLQGIGYSRLDSIERRFQDADKKRIHIYDRFGLAGMPDGDDDYAREDFLKKRNQRSRYYNSTDEGEDAIAEEEDDSNITVAWWRRRKTKGRKRRRKNSIPYVDLRTLLPNEQSNSIIPFMHVDGERFDDQLEILEAAHQLFAQHLIGAVAIEHSPDLDVKSLIAWFDRVKYKTFFLGSRQVCTTLFFACFSICVQNHILMGSYCILFCFRFIDWIIYALKCWMIFYPTHPSISFPRFHG